MEITKRVSGVGAFEEVFNQLEARVGSVLPDDYRRFMSEFNGGRPEPSGFVFPTEDGKSDSAVRYFLTLDDREGMATGFRKSCCRLRVIHSAILFSWMLGRSPQAQYAFGILRRKAWMNRRGITLQMLLHRSRSS
jgi:SMI1-KNR4 cell-wall